MLVAYPSPSTALPPRKFTVTDRTNAADADETSTTCSRLSSPLVGERIEGWRDHRTVWRNPDADFVCRAFEAGCTFVSTGELTVFKFNSSLRKNSYREKRDREQKAYIRRIRRSGLILLKETLDIAWVHHRRLPMKTPEFAP